MSIRIENLDSFIAEVKKSKDLPKEKMKDFLFIVAQDGYNRIVKKSPVDTGRFRASWRINEGFIDTSTEPPGDYKALSPFRLRSISKPYTIVYISNALPYAWKLELGGYTNPGKPRKVKGTKNTLQPKTTAQGFSVQAPQGMVSITLAELQSKYRVLE